MPHSRAVIVTGGTVGLGYQAALKIAQDHPDYLVVVASRSDKEYAAASINRAVGRNNAAVFRPVDLADLDNVRAFADDWAKGGAEHPPIQALLLNAGLQFPGELTKAPKSGLEYTFAVNHLGNAALFHWLVPFFATDDPKPARVVITSSGTHDPAQKTGIPDAIYTSAEDLAHPPADMINVSGRQRYASSKLANALWAYALDRQFKAQKKNIVVNAFDPGLVPGTDLIRGSNAIGQFLWKSVMPRILPLLRLLLSSSNIHTAADSGASLARLAVGEDTEGVTGKYFEGRKEIKSSVDSYNEKKQDDLFDWTVQYVAKGDAAAQARLREFR